MSATPNRRLFERWSLRINAELQTDGSGVTGHIHNLSLGGAFVESDARLPIGACLRLTFRLPNGMPVSVRARVVRVEIKPTITTPVGLGTEFYGMDDICREILESYFATAIRDKYVSDHSETVLEEKFSLETDAEQRVYLVLSGFLDRDECDNLADTMHYTLANLNAGGVRLCVNALRYQCCAPDSVEQFKNCFSQLASRPWFAAALVGPKSVGMMQMRRAARDANVADSFAIFEDVNEALEFLEMVQG